MSRATSESGAGDKGGGDAFGSMRDKVARKAREREEKALQRRELTAEERAEALGLGAKSARRTAPATRRSPVRAPKKTAAPARARLARTGLLCGGGGGGARRRGLLSRGMLALAGLVRRVLRWIVIALTGAVLLVVATVALLRWVDPPMGTYMLAERVRLGGIEQRWMPLEALGGDVARAAVAAEDARFCLHNGVDLEALQSAAEGYLSGERVRGASTISQQTAKNMFLWHGRSLVRKGLELPLVGLMEVLWGKRRILEIYLNIAEFDTGVFGVQAAAEHYYGRSAAALSQREAARLMVLLPNPKARDPRALSRGQERRSASIAAGSRTIAARDDDACFTG
ncbi:MAG: monofunctional biosynthetic peptidoglycan transglycosylase [Pseudomonadota bacterium]